jgi:hypothetical protein
MYSFKCVVLAAVVATALTVASAGKLAAYQGLGCGGDPFLTAAFSDLTCTNLDGMSSAVIDCSPDATTYSALVWVGDSDDTNIACRYGTTLQDVVVILRTWLP